MKVVICGKGGCGKSTIVSLLARQYAQSGRRVLVVDTDESNAGLHRILGTVAPADLLEYFGGKKPMMESFRQARKEETPGTVHCSWSIDEIPEGYISREGNLNLVAIGKIHQAGEGCACPMGVLAKKFLSDLKLMPDDVVIIDTEAGIEHFGRGIDKIADVIVMVIDPSYESLHLAKMVSGMAKTIGVPLYYLLNKIDPDTETTVRECIPDATKIIAEFRQDPVILTAGLKGQQAPSDYPEVQRVIEALETQK